jgi:hypothetical protein
MTPKGRPRPAHELAGGRGLMSERDNLDGDEDLPIEAFRRSPFRAIDVAEEESRLPPWTRELLACLRTRPRTAFVLRHAGMTYGQVALHLGISSSRVKQLCAAAEKRMVAAARRGATVHRPASRGHACAPAGPCQVPDHLRPVLESPIDILELSVRSHNSLWSRGVRSVGDLVRLAEIDVLKIKNLGHKSFREVVAALAHIGLHLGMDVGDWRPRQTSS